MTNPVTTAAALGMNAFDATRMRSAVLAAHLDWLRAQDPRWQLDRY